MVAGIRTKEDVVNGVDLPDNQLLAFMDNAQVCKRIEQMQPQLNKGELYPVEMFSKAEKAALNHFGYVAIYIKNKGYYCLPDEAFDQLKAVALGEIKVTRKGAKRRAMRAINIETGEQRVFRSANEAGRELECDVAGICRCLKGESNYRSVKGWEFSYADN